MGDNVTVNFSSPNFKGGERDSREIECPAR